MTHPLIGAALFALMLAPPASGPGDVTSTAHAFTVAFPAAPATTTIRLESGAAMDRWRWDGDGITLLVDVAPAGGADPKPADVLDTVAARLKQTMAKVLSDDPVVVDKVAGRALFGSVEGGFLSGRYFVRDAKLYQVYGATEVGEKDDMAAVKQRMERVTAFLETFHFSR
jgi:hypothetical protein